MQKMAKGFGDCYPVDGCKSLDNEPCKQKRLKNRDSGKTKDIGKRRKEKGGTKVVR